MTQQVIWITGGKGFIGRNLGQYLAGLSYSVFGLGHGLWAREDYSQWGYENWLNVEIDFVSLSQLLSNVGPPEVIFHLAGGAAVGASIHHPYEDFQRTVDTTARLLEWVRKNSPDTKVIGISSAAVYGAGFTCPISEQTQGAPFSPYGFHKVMLEALFASYRITYGLKFGIARLFSVYGPGLEKQLLWDICQKLGGSGDGEVLLQGTGQELRDWLHVSDACDLLWRIAKAPELPTIINGGTGQATSIAQIADLIVRAWGGRHSVKFSGINRQGDPTALIADITKAHELGFSPKTSIHTGIIEVVRWYRERQH